MKPNLVVNVKYSTVKWCTCHKKYVIFGVWKKGVLAGLGFGVFFGRWWDPKLQFPIGISILYRSWKLNDSLLGVLLPFKYVSNNGFEKCVTVWEKIPHVAKKLNWVNIICTCSLNFSTTCTFQNEVIFKIVDFISKWLLTNDGKAKLII